MNIPAFLFHRIPEGQRASGHKRKPEIDNVGMCSGEVIKNESVLGVWS